jgi:hypothetical protein
MSDQVQQLYMGNITMITHVNYSYLTISVPNLPIAAHLPEINPDYADVRPSVAWPTRAFHINIHPPKLAASLITKLLRLFRLLCPQHLHLFVTFPSPVGRPV